MEDNAGCITKKINKRKFAYDILRIILVFFVVLGHSSYYTVGTLYGGIDYMGLMKKTHIVDTGFHKATEMLTAWIYAFHMPAFIALSGMLFSMQMEKRSFGTVVDLIRNKAKRLLVPFAVVYFIWNIPIKLISGYYEGQNFCKAFLGQILFPNGMYLWYLEAIFLIFILAYFLNEKFSFLQQFCITLLLWFVGIQIERHAGYYVPLGNPFKYFLWFWIGMNLNREKYTGVIIKGNDEITALFFCAMHGVAWIAAKIVSHGGSYLMNLAVPLFAILSLNYACTAVEKRIGECTKAWIARVSSYSFGVYLYAEPLNYLILFIVVKTFGIYVLGNIGVAVAIYFARIIITVLMAILIVWMLKKSKMKNLY